MAKIRFKKKMYQNGGFEMVEDEGTAYETKNGIKVALSRDNHGQWIATELTTGKMAVPRSCRTRSELKSKLEEVSPILEKLLNNVPETKKQPRKDVKIKGKTKRSEAKKPRPNPFSGADDVYMTKNKIAVTKTTNISAKRSHTKTTKTKYYKQTSGNLKQLKSASGGTVRVGRTGNTYARL